jgi:hypothetical protein
MRILLSFWLKEVNSTFYVGEYTTIDLVWIVLMKVKDLLVQGKGLKL